MVAGNFSERAGCRDPSTACHERRDTAVGMTVFGSRRCERMEGFRGLELRGGRSNQRPLHFGGFAGRWRIRFDVAMYNRGL